MPGTAPSVNIAAEIRRVAEGLRVQAARQIQYLELQRANAEEQLAILRTLEKRLDIAVKDLE